MTTFSRTRSLARWVAMGVGAAAGAYASTPASPGSVTGGRRVRRLKVRIRYSTASCRSTTSQSVITFA